MKKLSKSFFTILTASILFLVECESIAAKSPAQKKSTQNQKIKDEPILNEMDSFDPSLWNNGNWTNGSMFNCGWQPDHITYKDGIMTITLDDTKSHGRPYTSGELRTNKNYSYGTYEVKMKAAKGSGVVSSFFTYTGKPWDEIDFEFLGKDTTKVQVNYFVNGKGEHEKLIDLGFDAAEDFHVYAFKWSKEKIEWYVDGVLKHTVKGKNLPSAPQQIMVNLWAGIGVDDWTGHHTYDGIKQAQYDYIKFTPEAN